MAKTPECRTARFRAPILGQTIGNRIGIGITLANEQKQTTISIADSLLEAARKSGIVDVAGIDRSVLETQIAGGLNAIEHANSQREMASLASALKLDLFDGIYSNPEQRGALGRAEKWLTNKNPLAYGYDDGIKPFAYRDDTFLNGNKYNFIEIDRGSNPLAGTLDASGATLVDDVVVTATKRYALHGLLDEPSIQLGNLAQNVGSKLDALMQENPEIGIALNIVDVGLLIAKGPVGAVASKVMEEVVSRGSEVAVGWTTDRFESARYQDAGAGGLGSVLGVGIIAGSAKGAVNMLRNSGSLIEKISQSIARRRAGPAAERIEYGALDALGRPTGVRATITEDMIGTGTAANPSIIPPGWSGNGTLSNEARGHLLGRQLGGSGDLAENLVTLQQNPANSPFMRGFENQVRGAVEGGQTVRYSSTPIYNGSNLVPRGVTLSGRGSGGFDLNVTILNPPGR